MGFPWEALPTEEGESGFDSVSPHIHTPYYNYDKSIINIKTIPSPKIGRFERDFVVELCFFKTTTQTTKPLR